MSRVLQGIIVISGLLCLLLVYRGFRVEPGKVVVRHFTVAGTPLAGALKGKRVVVVSDLHLGEGDVHRLRLLSLLEANSPDYLFLLGDYVRWGGDYKPAFDFLSKLEAPLGVYGVLGDYDHHNSRQSCLFCHPQGRGAATIQHSVQFLMNRELVLPGEKGPFRVVGLDSDQGEAAEIVAKQIPTLVLAHDPLLFDTFSGEEGVVMVAGDTHGGQIPLPSFVWRFLGYEKNARYNAGWFRKGDNRLFVTTGVGTSHLPFRLFCPPEVVVLSFE
ncbi:metallophosphoesterase [Desulfoluna sp.]|uniref:metallophosphoesterase n=1 Tax=Desulfoluna sp. TaxID=2045199 RepID=UPI0026028A9A|nr:metallophosphoesterase [Desulfoluna sp.]